MTDQELRELVASLAQSQRETDRRLRESGEETDRRMRESREETERVFREIREETERRNRELREEAERQSRELREEAERQSRELRQKLGGLSDKFGSFTEGLALPSMGKILRERFGMEVIAPSVRVRRNGHSMEIDVLAFSNYRDDIFVVEVKSHLREEALDQMRRILGEFRDFFPVYKDKKIYGILAAVDAPEALQERVLREGLYFARIHDDEFELQVPDGFQARAF